MHSLTILFVPENGKHTGREITESLCKALEDYKLTDKVPGVTLDNAAATTTCTTELSRLMVFDAEDQHLRCYAHILNLEVQDLLSTLKIDQTHDAENEGDYDGNIENESDEEDEFVENEIVVNEIIEDSPEDNDRSPSANKLPLVKLRTLFKVLKYSEQWQNKLQSCFGITNKKMHVPNIDVSTRWNSTFAMIGTAMKMQRSLHLLCEINEPLQKYLISDYEWLLLSKVYKFLRYFKELTEALSGEKYVTLPLIVIVFNMLVDRIAASIDVLREKADLCLMDESMLQALEVCLAKFMKQYEKSN